MRLRSALDQRLPAPLPGSAWHEFDVATDRILEPPAPAASAATAEAEAEEDLDLEASRALGL